MHDTGCPACKGHSSSPGRPPAGLTRRAVLRLGAVAGAAITVAPRARRFGSASLASAEPVSAVSPILDWPVPAIITRSQWGADESIREGGQEYDDVVEKLIVHHTVTPNHPADPASTVRGIYHYHTSGEYIDVAYNWLIDEQGRIYEGRWARDYAAGKAHTGEKAGEQVRGGHTYRHNSRTVGIAMLGTWTTVAPPAPALDALVTLLAWKCARWGIDPAGSSRYVCSDGAVDTLANIIGHRNAKPTTCPGDPLLSLLPSIRERVAGRLKGATTGYWITSSAGDVVALGDLPDEGGLPDLSVRAHVQAIAGHRSGRGYWLLGTDGGVFSFGRARFYGSTGGMRLNQPVVGIAATPTGGGYWLVARDGGIFSYGDAGFYGSTGGTHLNAPVVGMASTPSGKGYWLVARDGGVFNFGDAGLFGSAVGMGLQTEVVTLAPTHTGRGYWLACANGRVLHFGDAQWHGAPDASRLRAPVVDMAASSTGMGYSLLTGAGGVYSFGDAPYFGGSSGRLADAVGFAGRFVPARIAGGG